MSKAIISANRPAASSLWRTSGATNGVWTMGNGLVASVLCVLDFIRSITYPPHTLAPCACSVGLNSAKKSADQLPFFTQFSGFGKLRQARDCRQGQHAWVGRGHAVLWFRGRRAKSGEQPDRRTRRGVYCRLAPQNRQEPSDEPRRSGRFARGQMRLCASRNWPYARGSQ